MTGLQPKQKIDPFKTRRRTPRYSIEIDCSGVECSSYEPQFATYDIIYTEGNALDELLDNAVVFISDQDGGSLPELPADKDWMIEAITEKFHALAKDDIKGKQHADTMVRDTDR